MKHFFLLIILFVTRPAWGQADSLELPRNPATGLVSIRDSIHLGVYRVDSVTLLIEKWSNYMVDGDHATNYYGFSPKERRIKLGFTSVYNYVQQPGMLYKGGWLYYEKVDEKGNRDPIDPTNGDVNFNIVYGMKGEYLITEFTELSFSDDKNEMGRFEDARLLSSDGVHYLKENQKHWTIIRIEYYSRLKYLSDNLKSFISSHYRTPHRAIRMSEKW